MYDIILELYEQFTVVAASAEQAMSLCQSIVEGTEYFKVLNEYACGFAEYNNNPDVEEAERAFDMTYDIARGCSNLQDLQYCINEPGCAAH